MGPAELARRFGRLVALVVLVAAAYYFVVYLLRWEWNRALVAGVVFLAAEVFLVADLVFARLRMLSRQVERAHETEQISALAAQLRRNRPQSQGPFAWLSPPGDRTFVFVPILLAAGVVLSVLAFVVERLSRVTAAPVAEAELARGLSAMALPHEGLAPTGQLQTPRADEPRSAGSSTWRTAGIIAGVVAAITAFIVVLSVVLITRPAPADPNAAIVVDLTVLRNDLDQPEAVLAMSLWAICRVRIPADSALQELEATDPLDVRQFRMTVSPAPAEFDIREFVGCLQDAVIERARADVRSVSTVAQTRAA